MKLLKLIKNNIVMFKYGFQAFSVCIYSLLPKTTDTKTIKTLNAMTDVAVHLDRET